MKLKLSMCIYLPGCCCCWDPEDDAGTWSGVGICCWGIIWGNIKGKGPGNAPGIKAGPKITYYS